MPPKHTKKSRRAPASDSFVPIPVGSLRVFTDGACLDNGKPNAKGGYACVWPDHPELDGGWPLRDGVTPTNNRAEFRAFLRACKDADKIDSGASSPGERRTLHVFTDSMLLTKSVSSWIPLWRKNGWKKRDGEKVLNRDLCERIAEECDRRPIRMQHVRAHTGRKDQASVFNQMADDLAARAARRQESVKLR